MSGDQSAGRLLEDVAEVDDPAARVGDLDADRLLAGDRREDADVGRGQRVGEVVLELGDLADLDAGREAQLVAGDVRAGDHADDLRLDAEVAERLDQLRRRSSPARRCRARLASALERLRKRGSGTLQTKSGASVTRRAVAALRA